jgi:hypothetical protein
MKTELRGENRVFLPCIDKVVKYIIASIDDGGYGYVLIEFTDGTTLKVLEESQTGYISVELK